MFGQWRSIHREPKKYTYYKFQINEEADSSTCKTLANEYSYKVWALSGMSFEGIDGGEAVKLLFEDLRVGFRRSGR